MLPAASSHCRVFTVAALAQIIVAAAARAQAPTAPSTTRPVVTAPSAADGTERDETLLRLLENTITDVHYERVDFERIIQDLRDRYNLNIHVSWATLEAAGVRRDQRIEIQLKQVALTTALDLILREAGAGAPHGDALNYHVESGVVVIGAGGASREETVMRMYDIADFIESGYAIRRFANTPVLGLALTGREFVGGEERAETGGGSGGAGGFGGGGGGGGGEAARTPKPADGGGSIFGKAGEDPGNITTMERIDQLVSLIEEHIEPDSWRNLGGDIGSIQIHNSTMIIQQTLRAHQRIAQFLQMLRDSRGRSLNADVLVVRLRADKAAEFRQQAGASFPRLSPEAAAMLAQAENADSVLFRATTSGVAGQRMWFSALAQREAVVNAYALVGDSSSAYAPQTGTATRGLELILLPLLAPDQSALTLDVQMAWIPAVEIQPRAIRLGPGEAESTIDLVQRSMRTVSSQTSVRVGEAIVFSIPQELSPTGQAAEYEDWLVMRVGLAK